MTNWVLQGLTNYAVKEFLDGLITGYWKTKTFEQVRAGAARGLGLGAMDPKIAEKIRQGLSRREYYLAVKRVTYQDVMTWFNRSNGPLLVQCLQDPVAAVWLGRMWGEVQALIVQAGEYHKQQDQLKARQKAQAGRR